MSNHRFTFRQRCDMHKIAASLGLDLSTEMGVLRLMQHLSQKAVSEMASLPPACPICHEYICPHPVNDKTTCLVINAVCKQMGWNYRLPRSQS